MSNVIPPGGGGPKVPKPPTNDTPTIDDPRAIAADKSGAPAPKFNQGNASTDGNLNTLS